MIDGIFAINGMVAPNGGVECLAACVGRRQHVQFLQTELVRRTSGESLGFNDVLIRCALSPACITSVPVRHIDRKLGVLTSSQGSLARLTVGSVDLGVAPVESNLRYYHRRAAEERMAAQRAMTQNAREWHAKLAVQFAARAAEHEGSPAFAQAG